jgi:CDP-glucose 4,6-dehydratase
MNYLKIFKNKKIIVTGHTGFKGSWLTLWLNNLGGKVLGISKDVPTNPSHFKLVKLNKHIVSKKLNIQNLKALKNIIKNYKPDFVFHLAAQSLVKKSYSKTMETWKTNLIGTINILEALRSQKTKKETIVVLITSDKAYKNVEKRTGYKESDLLGGIDPYGASKSAADIAISSYIKSFFSSKKNKTFITIARAGNVIGGGDWSDNRLIPDCIRSWLKGKKVFIRNPNSTRPWQHVLEVLNGYLKLACSLKKNKKLHGEAFNFGPETKKNYSVMAVLKKIKKSWPAINWKIQKDKNFFENVLLQLDSRKAKKIIKWVPVLTFEDNVKLTVEWYRYFSIHKKNISEKSIQQINYYQKVLKKKKFI